MKNMIKIINAKQKKVYKLIIKTHPVVHVNTDEKKISQEFHAHATSDACNSVDMGVYQLVWT